MLLLFIFMFIAGVKAEGRPVTYYRVKSSSLCLHVRETLPFKYVQWKFNEKNIVLHQEIATIYKDRVDYYPNNHSLCIHRLTEADTGIFKVLLYNSDLNESTEESKLVVQAPVPKPVFRMSLGPHGSNLSAETCELAVNCSVLGDWLLALCSQDSCRTSEGSFSKVNITISTRNRSVICSGHNHVSVQNASENLEETCYAELNKKSKVTSPPFNEMVMVITVAVGVIFFAFIACLAVGLCLAKHNRRQTSTAHLIQNQPVEPHPQPATRESTSSSSQPEASYENVDVTQPPASSPSVNPQEEMESKQIQTVDTVYSVLQLPRVNDSNGKSDRDCSTKDHEVIEVASASESEHQTQVDSVYSMVQKPKT